MKQLSYFFTFRRYCLVSAFILFNLYLIPLLFSRFGEDTVFSSYIICCLCFFFLTILSSVLYLRDRKYVFLYSVIFIIKIFLGIAHYLYFVDPNYFLGSGDPPGNFWQEYQAVYNSINNLIINKIKLGIFFTPNRIDFGVTHPELWSYITIPYVFLKPYWLNFAPMNTFCLLVASMNVLLLSKLSHLSAIAEKYVFLFTAFFPLTLLNDRVYRDPMGMMLISIGLVACFLSNKKIQRFLSFVLLFYFGYLLRSMYAIIVLVAFGINWASRIKVQRDRVFIYIFIFILSYISLSIIDDNESDGYINSYAKMSSILALPIKIIFGMIGPFPWSNFLLYKVFPHYAFQLSDFLLGILQLGYLFAVFFNYKKMPINLSNISLVFGFGVMISGFVTPMMHIGYIGEGVFFTLPWLFQHLGKKFWKYLLFSFIILMSLNIIVGALGNISISSIWR